MKIYVNVNNEIKAINSTDDTSLVEIEVNREEVFGDMTDFMILNYCYKPNEDEYSICPTFDYSTIKMLDDSLVKKISILEAENETLKQELSITQDAVNELIFNSLNM